MTKANDPGKILRARLLRARDAVPHHAQELEDFVDERAYGILVRNGWATDSMVDEIRGWAGILGAPLPEKLRRNLGACIRNGYCRSNAAQRTEGRVMRSKTRRAAVVDVHEYAHARYCQRTGRVQQVRVSDGRWRRVDLRALDGRGLHANPNDRGTDPSILDRVAARYSDRLVETADLEVWWSAATKSRKSTAPREIRARQVTLRFPREELDGFSQLLIALLQNEREAAWTRVVQDK